MNKVPFEYQYTIGKNTFIFRLIRLDGNLKVYVGEYPWTVIGKTKHQVWTFFQKCYSSRGKRRVVTITEEKIGIEFILPEQTSGITFEFFVEKPPIEQPLEQPLEQQPIPQKQKKNWCFLFC